MLAAVHMQAILQEVVEMQPVAVIIDSIQTVYLDDVNGSAGSVSQARPRPLISDDAGSVTKMKQATDICHRQMFVCASGTPHATLSSASLS